MQINHLSFIFSDAVLKVETNKQTKSERRIHTVSAVIKSVVEASAFNGPSVRSLCTIASA